VRRRIAARLTPLITTALVVLGAASPRAQSLELPIFDTHIHYSAADWIEYPPDRILGILEKAGIRRALVSSTPDDGTLALHARDPKRIVPILRPYRTRDDMGHWWQDPAVLDYVQERLQKNRGVHKGIGEFHLFGGQAGTFVVKRITELAVQENIYLHAHSDELAIIELFTIEPRLKVIWAHAGMSSGPQAVGALLDRYPTLWVDLAIRNGDVAPGGTFADVAEGLTCTDCHSQHGNQPAQYRNLRNSTGGVSGRVAPTGTGPASRVSGATTSPPPQAPLPDK